MRAVIFDLFDTILDKVWFNYEKGLQYLIDDVLHKSITKEQLKSFANEFRTSYMLDRNETHQEISFLTQLEYFKSHLGFRKEFVNLDIEWEFFIRCRKEVLGDGVLTTLEYLKKYGYQMYIMSNSIFSAKTLSKYLSKYGVINYFNDVFSSADFGIRKPSKKCFELVMQKLKGSEHDKIFLVGNSYEKDVLGGLGVGLVTIYYQRDERAFNVPTIKKMKDFIEYLEENYIYVNTVLHNYSLVDGPGIRTVIFLQGCDTLCEGCHNVSSWDKALGRIIEIDKLANEIKSKTENKKITISGGEPFFQPKATSELIRQLKGFDICVYTSSEYEEIKRDFENILPLIHYLKVGKYKQELRTTMIPYVGSSNQRFLTLREGEIDE